MNPSSEFPQFVGDIFPSELEEIANRRRTRGMDVPEPSGGPSVNKGLVGVALSGGGIRSATFGMGVIQALIERGTFKFIDYVSTVSGGGYIGSCISSVLNHPNATERHFENRHGEEDGPVVKHLRNSGNYLSPGGLCDKLRLPTILLRGILLNLFLLVPSLILAVFLTEILNEVWHDTGTFTLSTFVIVVPFIIMTYLFAFIRRIFRNRFDWDKRNAYELNLSRLFALTVSGLCVVPIFSIVRFCVDGWWSNNIIAFFHVTSLEGGLYKALLVIGALVVFFVIINKIQTVTKITGGILRYVIGILGPLIIFSIYLVFCIFFIESPYLDESYGGVLDQFARGETGEKNRSECQVRLIHVLKGKGYRLTDSRIRVETDGKRQGWRISYRSGNDEKSLVITRAGGYLFIPTLSVFEAFRIRDRSIIQKVYDLRNRIQWQFYLFGILVFIINLAILDINITSSHGFYRDRLSKAYLFREDKDGAIISNDDQKMSLLNREGSVAPYHLINTALNLPGSDDPNLRGRNADFFTISKRYSGSEHTGYCPTGKIETLDEQFNLGTAMAVSAAAAAPNMGTMTMKQFVFIMTMLNVRLGYWTPNPEKINVVKKLSRWTWPKVGPRYLLKEALGALNAGGAYVNLSDGGHIENLGIYQLLKRRCSLIIAVDGEADPHMAFNGLVTLLRYAEIDMGTTIEIDLEGIRKNNEDLSRSHWALGTIKYGKGSDGREEIGHLLYLKASLTGDENEYLKAYWRRNRTFPHQTTADQFFDEIQFECYRALGEHIAFGALDDETVKTLMPGPGPEPS